MKHTHKKSWLQVRNINHLHPPPPNHSVNELLSNFYFEKKNCTTYNKIADAVNKVQKTTGVNSCTGRCFSLGKCLKWYEYVDFDCTLKYKNNTKIQKLHLLYIFRTSTNFSTKTDQIKLHRRGTTGNESLNDKGGRDHGPKAMVGGSAVADLHRQILNTPIPVKFSSFSCSFQDNLAE